MIKLLNNEWDRQCAIMNLGLENPKKFSYVLVTFEDGTTARVSKSYWCEDVKKDCIKNKWKYEYVY